MLVLWTRNWSKHLTERFVEGYYLKNLWKACVTHQLKTVGVGKHPGSVLTPFLLFLGQLLSIRAVGRQQGLAGPWSALVELPGWNAGGYVPS